MNTCKMRLHRFPEEQNILLIAEYIDYRGDYRLYNPDYPWQTVAYVDTIEEAQRDGYIIIEVNY